ncbi:MAG: zinc ABC transporter substrate-binding protein [Akkermansiaceae bacterium]|jgi:manganese/zinc/iron transport system substrate-binding protein|nr:zinc ABC transporter substrate-binding protein [Akkermansiaceae bacterium]
MKLLSWISATLVLALTSCDRGADPSTDGTFRVVATTSMIADVARQIAGPDAEVTALMGEGVDPHLYQPLRGDIAQLQAADLILYNGVLLEGKMTGTIERFAKGGTRTLAVAEMPGLIDEAEGKHDPHVWMDVKLWAQAAGRICDALCDADPENAAAYRQRHEAYAAELAELDDRVRQAIATIPEDRRVLVTAHDAFGYFSRAYGIEVRGIQGISTESEAGLKDLEALIQVLVERRIPAVFVESSIPRKSVEALVEGARAKGHEVKIGGVLFSDSMGRAGSYEGTYIGMIDHNVTSLTQALGGSVSPGGLFGKLPTTHDTAP